MPATDDEIAEAERLAPAWIRSHLHRSRIGIHDTDDLLQEARIGIHQAAAEFDRGQGVPFWQWARWKVRGRLSDVWKYYHRSRCRSESAVSLDGDGEGEARLADSFEERRIPRPLEEIVVRELWREIDTLLDAAGSAGEAFRLHRMGRRTLDEIARQLHLSPSATRQRVARVERQVCAKLGRAAPPMEQRELFDVGGDVPAL